jgi:hypothetical protein
MSQGMGLSLCMQLSQKQKLEQRIEQRLSQIHETRLTLEQHLAKEELVDGMLEWAYNHDSFAAFDKAGFKFQYARLPYEIAKPIAEVCGVGFAHCRYNPWEALINGAKVAKACGEWTLFVVNDRIPEGLEENVAIHERGEQLSAGDHFFASRLESAFAIQQRTIRHHIRFLDEEHPSKFLDMTKPSDIPKELKELLEQVHGDSVSELETAQRLMEQFPLPYLMVQKIARYDRAAEEVAESLRIKMGEAQNGIYHLQHLGGTPAVMEKIRRIADAHLRRALKSISPQESRAVVNEDLVNEIYFKYGSIVNHGLRASCGKSLVLPPTFYIASQIARTKEPLVALSSQHDASE